MKTQILKTIEQRRHGHNTVARTMWMGGRRHERKSYVARANGCSSCGEMAGK